MSAAETIARNLAARFAPEIDPRLPVAVERVIAEAARSVGESFTFRVVDQDEPGMANAYSQLAQIHLLLGDLTAAERHAHQACQIRERLGLKEAFRDYQLLAAIAHARNLPAEAAAWEQKRDALLADLALRAAAPPRP